MKKIIKEIKIVKKSKINIGLSNNLLKKINKNLLEAKNVKEIEENVISPLIKALSLDMKDGRLNNYIAFHLNGYKYPIRYLIKRIDIITMFLCSFMIGLLIGVLI